MADLLYSLYPYLDRVEVEIVSADSIKGVSYAIRYRVGKGPAVIVNGKVFQGRDISVNEIIRILNFQNETMALSSDK